MNKNKKKNEQRASGQQKREPHTPYARGVDTYRAAIGWKHRQPLQVRMRLLAMDDLRI